MELCDERPRIALVTGASKGIGQATALCLARSGYAVGINYHTDKSGAEATAAQIRALGRHCNIYQADLKDLAAIDAMFQAFFTDYGAIDVLVNNAGITRFAPFLETTPQLWDDVVNTDWRGSYFCAQAAARNMVANHTRGTIVNISSNHATGCWPRASVYGPAKAAVEKMTRNIALELAPYGIRMVGVAPGYTQVRQTTPDNEARFIRPVSSRIPMQRFARPEEIGNLVVYLVQEQANYITGTTIYMDGGALLPVVPENTYMT
ncbi:MAG: SDR family oxidoreductase [Kiritimatiellae bacterium]|nr:SDR family oxidoreductase [Kiritimatiellia bacterium]